MVGLTEHNCKTVHCLTMIHLHECTHPDLCVIVDIYACAYEHIAHACMSVCACLCLYGLGLYVAQQTRASCISPVMINSFAGYFVQSRCVMSDIPAISGLCL